MLSLEKVKNGLETFGYEYANNILCGHTKSKVKWALPTGIVNVMAFEQATSYLFGFSDNGITCFLFTAIGTLQTIYSFRGVK